MSYCPMAHPWKQILRFAKRKTTQDKPHLNVNTYIADNHLGDVAPTLAYCWPSLSAGVTIGPILTHWAKLN